MSKPGSKVVNAIVYPVSQFREQGVISAEADGIGQLAEWHNVCIAAFMKTVNTQVVNYDLHLLHILYRIQNSCLYTLPCLELRSTKVKKFIYRSYDNSLQ